jgi:hypothetical protein
MTHLEVVDRLGAHPDHLGQGDRYLGQELAEPDHDDVPSLDRPANQEPLNAGEGGAEASRDAGDDGRMLAGCAGKTHCEVLNLRA